MGMVGKFSGGETQEAPAEEKSNRQAFYVDDDTHFTGEVPERDQFIGEDGRRWGNILDPRGNVARADSIASGISVLVTDKVAVPLEPKAVVKQNSYEKMTEQFVSESGDKDTIYVPKIIECEEICQDLKLMVKVPTPHVVPSPVIVEVEVPIITFRNNYVCIPVRKRVIPRFVNSGEAFKVKVERQVPYLVIQDIIKPVPVDASTTQGNVSYEPNTVPPSDITQADYHQLWQRANAELLKDRQELLARAGLDPSVLERRRMPQDPAQLDKQILDDDAKEKWHPHHPIFLQHKWLTTPAQDMNELYSSEFVQNQLEAAQKMMADKILNAASDLETSKVLPENDEITVEVNQPM